MMASTAVLSVAAPPAQASPSTATATAPNTAGPGTPVKAVVVVSGPGPKVVGSFPAEGGQVSAGVLVLKVVFDQQMASDAWSYGAAEGRALPTCLDRPRLLGDKRTTVLLCSVIAHTDYAIQVNPTPQFASVDGRAAKSVVLHFATGDVAVRSLHDALSQADLTDADDPIMRWKDSGAGISHSAPAN